MISAQASSTYVGIILSRGICDLHRLCTSFTRTVDRENALKLYEISSLYKWKLRVAQEMIDILYYLHSRNLVWFDLKPSNFILVGDCPANSSLRAIDVGGCQTAGSEVYANCIQCTVKFTAPEIANALVSEGKEIGGRGACVKCHPSADLWSLGMCFFQLFRRDFVPYLSSSIFPQIAIDSKKSLDMLAAKFTLDCDEGHLHLLEQLSSGNFLFDDDGIDDDKARNAKQRDQILSLIRNLVSLKPVDRHVEYITLK